MDTPPHIISSGPAEPEPSSYNGRLRLFGAKLLIFSIFLLLGLLFYYGVNILLLTFAGILFGVFLRYLARWVSSKTEMPVRWAVIAVSVAMVAILGLGGWALAPKLAQQADQLTTSLPKAGQQLGNALSRYKWGQYIIAQAPAPEQVVSQNQGQIATRVANYFKQTVAVIGGLVSIFFLGIFFASSPSLYINGVAALVPLHREARTKEIMHKLGGTLECWLLGQFAAMAVVFVLTWLGLLALKIDYALALAIIAGLLAFIPNIGPVISAIPAVMIGMLKDPSLGIWVAVLYIVIQTVESYIITPLIQKRMVSLPPALVLTTQFLFGAALGTFGLTLATPLAAVLMVATRTIYVEDFLGRPRK